MTGACPCTSGKSFDDCCKPILEYKRIPLTAEELMRARFTSYATGQVEFVQKSQIDHSQDKFDLEEAKRWSRESTWLGLTVHKTEQGGLGDTVGEVEFTAHYKDKQGHTHNHHERSRFKKVDGQWFFDAGQMAPGNTFRREAPKVGRNDICPCGSAKKYKKCCGA